MSTVIIELQENQVRRKFFIGLGNKQTNAAKALVRRHLGENTLAEQDEATRERTNKRAGRVVSAVLNGKEPHEDDVEITGQMLPDLLTIQAAMAPLIEARVRIEKDMRTLAKSLAVYEWALPVKGLGEIGLAVIVGEAGNLSAYPTPRHLWKRLGLAPLDGRAMSNWRKGGGDQKPLSPEQWTDAGYNPRRRAEIYSCVQDSLFRQQTCTMGPYRDVYDARRAHTESVHPEWKIGSNGKPLAGEGKGHYHDDACRIMVKALLKDLWRAWQALEIPCEGTEGEVRVHTRGEQPMPVRPSPPPRKPAPALADGEWVPGTRKIDGKRVTEKKWMPNAVAAE